MAATNGQRPAPYDEHAEAALLGAALTKPEVAAIVASLDVDQDFYCHRFRAVAAAITTLHHAGQPTDPVSVAAALTGDQLREIEGVAGLLSLQVNTPSLDPATAAAWAGRLRGTRGQRHLITLGGQLTDAGYTGADPATILDDIGVAAHAQSHGGALQRALLGDLIRTGVPAPTMVHPWLYAGGLHAIQSEPGVGKSWLILWLAVQIMNAGQCVVYMDEEGGEELVAERLAALGADPEIVDRLLWYFPFPERRWTAADLDVLRATITEASLVAPVAMGVLDSLPDFLAAAAMSEDSSMDVTTFVRRLLTPFREVGAALVVLDHIPKPDTSSSPRSKTKTVSRYGRGSGAKLAKTHATFLLETAEPFDRSRSGGLRMWVTKDRRGYLGLPHHADSPLPLEVAVGAGTLAITAGTPTINTDIEAWSGPTRCMEEILATLKPGDWLSGNQIAVIMKYKRATVLQAVRELADSGDLLQRAGPRGSIQYAVAAEGMAVQEQF